MVPDQIKSFWPADKANFLQFTFQHFKFSQLLDRSHQKPSVPSDSHDIKWLLAPGDLIW